MVTSWRVKVEIISLRKWPPLIPKENNGVGSSKRTKRVSSERTLKTQREGGREVVMSEVVTKTLTTKIDRLIIIIASNDKLPIPGHAGRHLN